MRRKPMFPLCLVLLAPIASVTSPLLGPAGAQAADLSLEGEGVVSTPASEVRGSVSPDGRRIVWGSTDRKGGAGGWDLWQARRLDGRWVDAQPLSVSSPANDFDPLFSADGRWLYFFSNREGGHGGDDLYRAPVLDDGGFGAAANLGAEVNGPGDEWAPTPSADGRHLLFASDSFAGAGRHDLFVARWDGKRFSAPRPVPGINTPADEFDAAWVAGGRSIVFARSANVEREPIRLWLAHCDGERYADAVPWTLPFNGEDGYTLGPTVDASRPREMLISGAASAPRAGRLDIYRVSAPETAGRDGCTSVAASAAPASAQDASAEVP